MALFCCVTAYFLIGGCGTGSSSAPGSQRFYIADTANSRIVRTDDFSGTNWTTFGTVGIGTDELDRPTGIAFDSSNNIYIVDSGNGRIVRMSDFTGTNWTTFGSEGFAPDQFNHPSQIAIDSLNNLYITDTGNNRVVMINAANFATGAGWTTLGGAGSGVNQFNAPTGIYLDSQRRIYVADSGNNRIVTMNNITGAGWSAFGSLGSATDQFNTPTGIAQDAQGLFYITDSGNNRVVRVSGLTGINVNWTTIGAGLGFNLTNFNDPTAIAIYNYPSSATSTTPYVYVVDTGNSRVVRYAGITDTDPLIIGFAGNSLYQFSSPSGMTIHQ